jgi:hypothetical protein
MSWTHRKSGQAFLSSRIDRANLAKSTLTTDSSMWTRSFGFYGNWLDLETIKVDPLGHY